MHEGQDARRGFPERAQRLGKYLLQIVEVGKVPVAGCILRLIPQPFHRVEFRTNGGIGGRWIRAGNDASPGRG